MNQLTILTEIKGNVAHLWLNRPDYRNALNMVMIEELLSSLQKINSDRHIRIICLHGKGPSFCSGADLRWMQQAALLAWEDNYRESKGLALCFRELYDSKKITLAGIHGAAFGGAIGLVAACDMAVSTETAVFAFSEVKLGLVPATIMPFILQKSGNAKTLEYMLTGRKFTGAEAAALGLVNRSVPEHLFDQALEELIKELLQTAPSAQREIKKLYRSLTAIEPERSTLDQTVSLLAKARVSEEAKEGIRAFLEKRPPGWINT